MLMFGDKKKPITMIMAKIGKKPDNMEKAPMEDGAEQDSSVGAEAAAEELMKAIESKSAAGIVEAFKSLMELCESESEPEQEQKPE